jgi:hypothetical protein
MGQLLVPLALKVLARYCAADTLPTPGSTAHGSAQATGHVPTNSNVFRRFFATLPR